MRGIRLIWQLIPSYLLVTAVSVAAITWFASVAIDQGEYLKAVVVGIVVVVLAAVVSLVISRRITRPLDEIRHSAERFASGDLSLGDYTPSSREIDALAQAMNKMAGQLNADMTRLQHLENMRRDFVANVSHELRTPITTIKGFVETLLDGAMKNPEEARRFLDIVARHADRLNAIIEDLLVLSRIEQGTGENDITFENVHVGDVLVAAVQTCERKAIGKQINIELDCDQTITARVNPVLLEQAVVNLGDNAIKYSELGSRVSIKVVRESGEIAITVSDSGCGIAEEHLPRLFERFYRVDKARSRKLGGTGLGLAIVKHIAQAHGGRATVMSRVDEGSTFSIHLPITRM